MIAGLRAVVVLALCCASLILFGWQVQADSAAEFTRNNLLSLVARTNLVRITIIGTALGLLAGVVSLAIGGMRAAGTLRRTARLLAPLTLIGLVPPLLVRDGGDPLSTVLTFAVFTLVLERLLRVSFGALRDSAVSSAATGLTSRQARRLGLGVVVALALFYGLYMSRYTVFMHRRFQTSNFDLGQYDNIFWTTLHGHPLWCTPLGHARDWGELANHADLGVFFLLPFYALRPHPETLLIMQSCILGLGAIPLYLFAVRRLTPAYACALSICYLLFPPMHGANFYDFHFQPIASAFVLTTIWLVDARKWIWCALAFLVALSCREDISVGLAALGVFLLLTGHRPFAGMIMAVAGVAYFATMRFNIMPHFGPSWFSEMYKDLYPVPDGPRSYGGVVMTLLTNPFFVFRSLLTSDKLRYILLILTPVAFLPLRRAYLWPALLPGSLFTLLTTAYPPTIDTGFQYSQHFTPYAFAGSAVALATYRWDRDGKARLPAALCALAIGTFFCTKQWGAFPPTGSVKGGFQQIGFARPTAADEEKARNLAELATLIPDGALYAVSEPELPHVSGSLYVRTLKDGIGPAEYLLYGTGSFGANVAEEALARDEFYEVARRPGLFLVRRKTGLVKP